MLERIRRRYHKWAVDEAADFCNGNWRRFCKMYAILGLVLVVLGGVWDSLAIMLMGGILVLLNWIIYSYTKTIEELGVLKQFIARQNRVTVEEIDARLAEKANKRIDNINRKWGRLHKQEFKED